MHGCGSCPHFLLTVHRVEERSRRTHNENRLANCDARSSKVLSSDALSVKGLDFKLLHGAQLPDADSALRFVHVVRQRFTGSAAKVAKWPANTGPHYALMATGIANFKHA
jgi:hypothetical protein